MRKFFYLLLSALLLHMMGCIKPGERTRMVDKRLPLEELVDTFMKEHPDYLNNEVTMQNGDVEFQKVIIDTTINYIEGIPLELKKLCNNGKSYMAQFQCWHTTRPYFDFQEPIQDAHFDIITAVPDSMIVSLKEGEYYTLSGVIIERIANINVFRAMLGNDYAMAYTPTVGIRRNDIWKEKYDVEMGMIYFHLDSLKPYTEREKVEEKY